jgi:hypothetical protein
VTKSGGRLAFRGYAAAHADRVTWLDLNAYLCPLSKWRGELGDASVFPDGIHFSQVGGEIV